MRTKPRLTSETRLAPEGSERVTVSLTLRGVRHDGSGLAEPTPVALARSVLELPGCILSIRYAQVICEEEQASLAKQLLLRGQVAFTPALWAALTSLSRSSDSLPSVSEKWKSPGRSSESPWKDCKSSMQHNNILPPLTVVDDEQIVAILIATSRTEASLQSSTNHLHCSMESSAS